MKVAVFGAGSVGVFLGAKLQLAGHDVVFVGRETFATAAKKWGVSLSDLSQPEPVSIVPSQLRVITSVSSEQENAEKWQSMKKGLEDRDYILITVKSKDTASVCELLHQLDLPTTVRVASFQNGVGNGAIISRILTGHPVTRGIVGWNVIWTEEGNRFHRATSNPLVVENVKGESDELVAALRQAGFETKGEPEIEAVQWTKLAVNLNNAVNALSGKTLIQQFSDRLYRKVLSAQLKEALTVIAANGIKIKPIAPLIIPRLGPFILALPNWLYFIVARSAVTFDKNARSSMADDLEKRRLTEIDELQGKIVTLGEKKGIPTPINKRVFELIRAAEKKAAGSPKISAEKLYREVMGKAPSEGSSFRYLVWLFFGIVTGLLVYYYYLK